MPHKALQRDLKAQFSSKQKKETNNTEHKYVFQDEKN